MKREDTFTDPECAGKCCSHSEVQTKPKHKMQAYFESTKRERKKSETRMTASVLKQDPNILNILKNAYLLTHNLHIFGVIPFVKLQNNM